MSDQKYTIGEEVGVQGWGGGLQYGTIVDAQIVYHRRMYENTWGYLIEFDEGSHNPFTMKYIPQGYLRKKKINEN